MNGIEKITELIRTDAQTEIGRVLEDARRAAEAEKDRAEACAETERAELTAKYEKAAAEREERLISAAQMEARKILLAAKQEMVEKAYIRAQEKLCAMDAESYANVLSELLVQASSDGTEEAVFSPEDRERVGRIAVERANAASGRHLTLSQETLPIQGGFILRSGNVEVNCTFDTLVRLEKAETAGAVAKILFPEK